MASIRVTSRAARTVTQYPVSAPSSRWICTASRTRYVQNACARHSSSCLRPLSRTTASQISTVESARSFSLSSCRAQESTIQGTIGAGAEGVKEEAQRAVEGLTAPEHLNEKETEIWRMLNERLNPVLLEVQDISGGCGSMYGIEVVSEAFRGLNMLKQQRLVNEILGDEIKQWHGVQLKTRTP